MKSLEFLEDLLVKTRLDEEIVSEDIVFDIKESIEELKSIQSNDCNRCQGFVRDDYCSIIDDDCRVVMERCNGCRQFIPKDNA